MNIHKFDYRWTLKDATFTKDKGKVFSCFACGGGSTMGYKLAGFDVIGCNEIDPRMNNAYVTNHHPRFNYCEPIQEFKQRKDLPAELYELDVLDGSPPCSTFSLMGNRADDWGKERKFKEGQKAQVLDTLFFDFIDLAKDLQPKVVIAENVKGLLLGPAMGYVRRIYEGFSNAGYYCQHFLIDAATMGVPQHRERVFFVCLRKDIAEPFLQDVSLFDRIPYINMEFKESDIPFGEIRDDSFGGKQLSEFKMNVWNNKRDGDLDCGDVTLRLFGKENGFNDSFVYSDRVVKTINTEALDKFMLWDIPRRMNEREVALASSFPIDYDYSGEDVAFICGMSVPPVMMAQVASRVYDQWLSKI